MHIKFSLGYLILSILCLYQAYITLESVWASIGWCWPGLTFLLISISYSPCGAMLWCGNGESLGVILIAKSTKTGQLNPISFILLFPYFVLALGWWYFRQTVLLKRKEAPFDCVCEDIYIGRYPIKFSEFPATATNIVDCTAEFPARKSLLAGRKYICCPGMDMELASARNMARVAREVAIWDGETYIHCANGHGRSASVAALVMILRNRVSSVDEAFTMMKVHRKLIHINATQRIVLENALVFLNTETATL